MSPKQFLRCSGLFFLALAVLGFVWPGQQLYPTFYLDQNENFGHLIIGLVILSAAHLLKNTNLQKWLVILVGILGLYLGVRGFVVAGKPEPNYYGIVNLEMLDNLLHLAFGAWAFCVVSWKRKEG